MNLNNNKHASLIVQTAHDYDMNIEDVTRILNHNLHENDGEIDYTFYDDLEEFIEKRRNL